MGDQPVSLRQSYVGDFTITVRGTNEYGEPVVESFPMSVEYDDGSEAVMAAAAPYLPWPWYPSDLAARMED